MALEKSSVLTVVADVENVPPSFRPTDVEEPKRKRSLSLKVIRAENAKRRMLRNLGAGPAGQDSASVKCKLHSVPVAETFVATRPPEELNIIHHEVEEEGLTTQQSIDHKGEKKQEGKGNMLDRAEALVYKLDAHVSTWLKPMERVVAAMEAQAQK